MDTLGKRELEKLAEIIVRNLNEEFEAKHLSKNLINTVVVRNYGNEITIEIPAQVYDMRTYQEKRIVVHNRNESYASKLDEEGSSFVVYQNGRARTIRPRNHKGFANRIVDDAITERKGSLDGKVKKVEG